MIVEAGKFYKDAEGKKRGPMDLDENNEYWHYEESVSVFKMDGRSYWGDDPDLIEEWQDEPADEYDMTTEDAIINSNLRNAAIMLINTNRCEDAISILYILKGDNG